MVLQCACSNGVGLNPTERKTKMSAIKSNTEVVKQNKNNVCFPLCNYDILIFVPEIILPWGGQIFVNILRKY